MSQHTKVGRRGQAQELVAARRRWQVWNDTGRGAELAATAGGADRRNLRNLQRLAAAEVNRLVAEKVAETPFHQMDDCPLMWGTRLEW